RAPRNDPRSLDSRKANITVVNFDALKVAQNGLAVHEGPRKKVLIIGAGMAGLTAAYELIKQGHEPLILEARSRVGGRVYTLREPFAEGLHAEAGAMRIPSTHDLTLHYIRCFNLELMPFTMGNPQAYYFFQGQRLRAGDCDANPALIPYPLSANEQGRSVAQLWEQTIQEFVDQVKADGGGAWDAIASRYDKYSTLEFLQEKGWSENAIELFGLLDNQEAEMNYSFVEMLREEVGDYYRHMWQVVGGTDRLPAAFYNGLKGRVRFGAAVHAIDQGPDDVTAHYSSHGGSFEARADHMIVTVPFSVLRHIEMLKPFSHAKQKAIRELHYDASAKIFLQCRRRFWEEDDGIFGGGTVSDLAIRNTYYPEHGRETGRGVLLASYTWSEDAERWGSLSPNDRIEQAVEDVAKIHPQILQEVEGGASIMWHDDEFAAGAFALFEPEQQTRLYQDIIAPEGRIHIAGEHASLGHAWIQGAIESGLRAAWEINEA
ncbi:MAG: flavin monoamine oxidase family protein, partial [Rudaea sp.]